MSKSKVTLIAGLTVTTVAGLYWAYFREEQPKPLVTSVSAKPIPAPPKPAQQQEGLRANPYALFRMGDFKGAAEKFRERYNADRANAELRRDFATSLFAYGISLLEMHQTEAAEASLEEAGALGQMNAHEALAHITLQKGNVPVAMDLIWKVFQKSKDPALLRSLVELSFNTDDLEKAEEFLQEAAKGYPHLEEAQQKEHDAYFLAQRKRLQQRKLLAAREEIYETGSFAIMIYGPSYLRMAQALAGDLERAIDGLAEMSGLGQLALQNKLKIMLVPDASFYEISGAPPWAGAVFDGTIRIPVPSAEHIHSEMDRLFRIARHELTHAYFYYQCGDKIPSWLGEGLAQIQEGRDLQYARLVLQRRLGAHPSGWKTETSLDSSFIQAPSAEVPLLYARALMLTLLLQQQSGNVLWKNVFGATCRTGTPFGNALRDEVGEGAGEALWGQKMAM